MEKQWDPKGNDGLEVIMIYQCRLINCNKCATLDRGKLCICGAGIISEMSTSSPQLFSCEFKTALSLSTNLIYWLSRCLNREFQKNICFCFIDYAKAFGCVDHNKLWRILKEMGIPDHLSCLMRNLYVGQEATVRTGHGTTDWFQIRKGVRQGCILSLLI